MKPNFVYIRTVRRAIALAGGMDELAALLEVPSADIEAWETGQRVPDPTQFLYLLDVVAGTAQPARNRR